MRIGALLPMLVLAAKFMLGRIFMKKMFLVVLFIFGMAAMLFAQESGSGGDTVTGGGTTSAASSSGNGSATGLGAKIRVGYSFPLISLDNEFGEGLKEEGGAGLMVGLLGFALSSFTVGGGLNYTIVPHVLAPGIYFDLSFNLLSWSIAITLADTNLIMFQGGARIFNEFAFTSVSFEPFFGVNFLHLNMGGLSESTFSQTITLLAAGLIINFGRFSIEYGYNFYPVKVDEGAIAFHRITFSGIVWQK
jgi:hypothetical protein